jgi:hypothetical protein
MTEAQLVTLMFTAPFLLLSIFWVVGLALFEYQERKAMRHLKSMIKREIAR